LLNEIASSISLNWDDYNLTKIIGFHSSDIKCSDNLIPLPLLSQFYMISSEYCLLTKCALNAVALKYKADATCKDPYGKLFEDLKDFFTERRKQVPNKQKDLAKWVITGMKKYCMNHKEIVNEGIRLPRESVIIKTFNQWNKYIKATNDEKETMNDCKPYPKYQDILYDTQENVEEWGERIFAPTCIEERRRKKGDNDRKRVGEKKEMRLTER